MWAPPKTRSRHTRERSKTLGRKGGRGNALERSKSEHIHGCSYAPRAAHGKLILEEIGLTRFTITKGLPHSHSLLQRIGLPPFFFAKRHTQARSKQGAGRENRAAGGGDGRRAASRCSTSRHAPQAASSTATNPRARSARSRCASGTVAAAASGSGESSAAA